MFFLNLFLSFVCMVPSAHAREDFKAKTIAGFFQIKELDEAEEFTFHAYLDENLIYRFDIPYVSISERYYLKDRTLLVLHLGYGGASTTPEYVIVDVSKKATIMSERFFSKSQVPSFSLKQRTIEIDLGFDSGQKKSGTYQDGVLDVQWTEVTDKVGDQPSCQYMYDHIYTFYIV